jgi:hypothetical protein
MEFVDLGNDTLEDVGGVDLVFDVIGGDIQRRSAGLVRAGGRLVSVVGYPVAPGWDPVTGLGSPDAQALVPRAYDSTGDPKRRLRVAPRYVGRLPCHRSAARRLIGDPPRSAGDRGQIAGFDQFVRLEAREGTRTDGCQAH